MGALEQLAAELLGHQSQDLIARENPYYQFVAPAQAFSQGALSAKTTGDNPRAEMWNKAIAASVGGLLGGGLQGLGNNYQNVLTDRYQRALGASLLGQEPSAEGLPPGLFGAAKRGGALFKAVRGAGNMEMADRADAEVELQDRLIDIAARKRMEEIYAEDAAWKAANGGGRAGATPTKVVKPGLLPVATGADGTTVVAEVPVVEDVAPSPSAALVLPKGNPNNPYFKQERADVERQQDLSEKIRKEFNALPEVKNFSTVVKGAGIVAKAAKDPSAVADQELVRYAILMIEPGMAVREGEQKAVAMSQSIPEAIRGGLLKAIKGEAALGPQARQGILRLAARAYEGHKGQYQQALGFYKSRFSEVGLDPANLSYLGEAPLVENLVGGGDAGDQSRGNPPPPQVGKRRYWNGKGWEYK